MNIERDHQAVILWSVMDGDFQDEERSKLLLGWCDSFRRESKTYFDKFRELSGSNDFVESSQSRLTGPSTFTSP
jgi:hypothetical protein